MSGIRKKTLKFQTYMQKSSVTYMWKLPFFFNFRAKIIWGDKDFRKIQPNLVRKSSLREVLVLDMPKAKPDLSLFLVVSISTRQSYLKRAIFRKNVEIGRNQGLQWWRVGCCLLEVFNNKAELSLYLPKLAFRGNE